MTNHALNVCEILVCGSGLVGKNVLGVEDVQAFVFHRAHVEVRSGDDHETVKVQAQTKAVFIPRDTGNE